jgi:hypothetical protein
MNTKVLLAGSSILLGLVGIIALFAPQEVLAALHVPVTQPLPLVIQLIGAFYCSFALTNWTAKDSTIGGIYARPTSLGNFAHFTVGALALAKYHIADEATPLLLVVLSVYAILAILFGWLVFVHSGTASKQ